MDAYHWISYRFKGQVTFRSHHQTSPALGRWKPSSDTWSITWFWHTWKLFRYGAFQFMGTSPKFCHHPFLTWYSACSCANGCFELLLIWPSSSASSDRSRQPSGERDQLSGIDGFIWCRRARASGWFVADGCCHAMWYPPVMFVSL